MNEAQKMMAKFAMEVAQGGNAVHLYLQHHELTAVRIQWDEHRPGALVCADEDGANFLLDPGELVAVREIAPAESRVAEVLGY